MALLSIIRRWHHPVHGTVAPGSFIPMVAALGLQTALFRRVVQLTLAAATTLQEAGASIPLAINACAITLSDHENLDFLLNQTLGHKIDPTRLKIELTEDTPVADMGALKAALCRLRASGYKVCIEDFGSGNSNLSLLINLPLDELKLDRELVARIGESRVARQSVLFAVDLAKDMGWQVVAEGISTKAELDAIYAMGCRYGQGFLLGRPMTLDALIEHIGLRRQASALFKPHGRALRSSPVRDR